MLVLWVNEFEFFFYFVGFPSVAHCCSQNVDKRVRAGKKQPQRLDPRGECLFPSPICFVLRPFQFVYIWPRLERDSLLIYCLDFLRVPLKAGEPLPTAQPPFFRPCYDKPPSFWFFFFFKGAPISINVSNMWVMMDVIHTRAHAPPHTWDKHSLHIINVCRCLLLPSGWFVFLFCDSCLCTLIVLMKGPEIVQNHFYESKESFQRKVEMLL